jgi:peptide/nickel transport system permease protein
MSFGRARIRATAAAARRLPLVPTLIIVAMVVTAIFADFLAPYSPYDISLPDKGKPPFWVKGGSTEHLLGTDLLGRDTLSRLIYGTRVSLTVVAIGLLLAGAIGTTLALVAGYFGGAVDAVIMRAVDATLSLPVILLALLLTVVLGPSLTNLIYVMGIVLWARYARVVRGEVLSWKEREFVAYARVAGTSPFKIIIRHIFPNVVNTLMVMLTFQTGYIILLEAGLSFLGAGVPPPTPSWGVWSPRGGAISPAPGGSPSSPVRPSPSSSSPSTFLATG